MPWAEAKLFIDWMHERFLHKEEKKVDSAPMQRAAVSLTDSELIDKIRASASGAKFEALYLGVGRRPQCCGFGVVQHPRVVD